MKSSFLIAFILFSFSQVYSQIKSVSYDLRYNAITNQYDAYLIILDGEAHRSKDRIQFNAQLSIITPSNTSFTMEKSYMPLENNNNYKGNKSVNWEVSNNMDKVSAIGGNSIYSIAPKLNKTGYYNDMKVGDEVKLFSIEVSPMPINKADVRLYSNTSDPKSKDLFGSDFRNGFTIGGVAQVYNEMQEKNTADLVKEFTSSVYPNPAINHVNVDITSAKEEKVNISIVDVNGREVLNNTFDKKNSGLMTKYLPLNVAPGIYSMKVAMAGQTQEHKIVFVGQL
jgi:hypothetical protein